MLPNILALILTHKATLPNQTVLQTQKLTNAVLWALSYFSITV